MAYKSLQLLDGDILTSEHIRHIEDGILELQQTAENMKKTMVDILKDKDVNVFTDESLSDILHKFTYLKNPEIKNYEYSDDIIDIRKTVESGTIQMVAIDAASLSFKIRATNGFIVDWGDNTTNTYGGSGLTTVSHNYTVGSGAYYNGTHTQYIVTVYPYLDGKITEVQSNNTDTVLAFCAKDIYFMNMNSMFANMTRLKYIDIIGGSLGTADTNASMSAFASNANQLERISSNVCWNSITTLNETFNNCQKLVDLDLGSSWDTRNCTTFNECFSGCFLLKHIPAFNTSSATAMIDCFNNCTNLVTIGADTFDLTNCTNINNIFKQCEQLLKIPYLANTSSISSANQAFYYCSSIKKLHDKQLTLDLSAVNNASSLFNGCTSLEEAPELILTAATNVNSLFANCRNLYIVQEIFDLPNVIGTNTNYNSLNSGQDGLDLMFYNCSMLTNAPQIYAPNAVSCKGLFNGCSNLVNIPAEYSFPNVLGAIAMFQSCSLMQTAPRIIDLPKAQYIDYMFADCVSLKIAPAPNEGDSFEFPEALSANNMFNGCTSLQTAPYELILPKCTNIGNMFRGCTSLQTAPQIIEFGSATNIESFFRDCSSLQVPPIKFSAPKATKASELFFGCNSLLICPELDLPVCTTFSSCFRNCTSLTSTIPYYFPKATSLAYFYSGCTSLSFIEQITVDTASVNCTAFATDCKNIEVIAFPVSTTGHITWEGGSSQVPINNADTLRHIANSFDVFSGSHNYMTTHILASEYLEGTIILSGLKNAFTLNNKKYLTGFRLLNVQTGMANISITNCALDAEALNQLFEDLPKVSSTRTITVKGNPGAETCDTSIATAKNWTVVYI